MNRAGGNSGFRSQLTPTGQSAVPAPNAFETTIGDFATTENGQQLPSWQCFGDRGPASHRRAFAGDRSRVHLAITWIEPF